jgi:hypothetical protein
VIANAYNNANGEPYSYHGGTYDQKHGPMDKLTAGGNKEEHQKDAYCYQDLDHHTSKCVWSLFCVRVAVCQWLVGFLYFDVYYIRACTNACRPLLRTGKRGTGLSRLVGSVLSAA